jgi:alkanesulfonate monooxygenase SsuD/methylene tetrahydromethanopterin reductase-like flavin-dependent oxidoreductase (luciferase family)
VGVDDAQVARRVAAAGVDAAELAVSGLVGTPDQVVERIGRYAEAGSQRLYLQVRDLDDVDQLELIAAQVSPQLR